MLHKTLNLKNAETHQLAKRVSQLTGESMTQAVTSALRERLSRLEPPDGHSMSADLMEIGADCSRRLSPKTKRLDHAKLLYDDRGLPKILDASAVIAILRQEPEARAFADAMQAAPTLRISAANFVEASIVIDAERDPVASRRLDDLLRRARVEIAAITPEQADLAREAYRNFGRGSGHPAKLNFGDCFAHALAVSTGEPILCKGDEFKKAGLRLVIPKG